MRSLGHSEVTPLCLGLGAGVDAGWVDGVVSCVGVGTSRGGEVKGPGTVPLLPKRLIVDRDVKVGIHDLIHD